MGGIHTTVDPTMDHVNQRRILLLELDLGRVVLDGLSEVLRNLGEKAFVEIKGLLLQGY